MVNFRIFSTLGCLTNVQQAYCVSALGKCLAKFSINHIFVGKGGSKIRELEEDSGCKIQVITKYTRFHRERVTIQACRYTGSLARGHLI